MSGSVAANRAIKIREFRRRQRWKADLGELMALGDRSIVAAAVPSLPQHGAVVAVVERVRHRLAIPHKGPYSETLMNQSFVETIVSTKLLPPRMGPAGLKDDPRFATNAARIAYMDETDALVAAWTRTLGKIEVFARTTAYRIPCAPRPR